MIMYTFARKVELDNKKLIENVNCFKEYIRSKIDEWNNMFRLIDLAVNNVTDMKENPEENVKEFFDKYSEEFPIYGVNKELKELFLMAISKIIALHRTFSIKFEKEAYKMIKRADEEIKNFPCLKSEKKFFEDVVDEALDDILFSF